MTSKPVGSLDLAMRLKKDSGIRVKVRMRLPVRRHRRKMKKRSDAGKLWLLRATVLAFMLSRAPIHVPQTSGESAKVEHGWKDDALRALVFFVQG